MTLEEKRTYYSNRSEQMIQQMCELTGMRIEYGVDFTELIKSFPMSLINGRRRE